jgi:O-antigen ligase
MINNIKKIYYHTNYLERILFILFAFFPISIVLGNLLINITFLLISIIFIINLTLNKDFSFLRDINFLILVFFFISLLINVYFSTDPSHSYPRVVKVLMMVLFVTQFKKIINTYTEDFEKIIFGFWSIIFIFVILDGIFEIIFGFNTLGFESHHPGRIAGFFGDELVLGSFLLIFAPFFLGYVFGHFKENKKIFFFLILSLVIISLMIGERANFIRFVILIFLFSIFTLKLRVKDILAGLIPLTIIIVLIISFNESYNYKFYQQFANFSCTGQSNYKSDHSSMKKSNEIMNYWKKKCKKDKSITNFFKGSIYGAQFNGAYKVFLENPIFGVGIKNYRMEAGKQKYENKEFLYTQSRWSTHPHQIHFEILSETGLFGYICFLVFIIFSLYLSIKNYLKNKNTFQLTSILYIIVLLIPFLPTGSFFSTFSSCLFWINYAVMMSYNKRLFN